MSIFKKRRRDYHGMTYHADSKRVEKQKKSSRLRKFLNRVYGVIIFGTLIWLAYFVLFTPVFKFREVEFINGKEVSRNEMTRVTDEFLGGRRYKIFSQRNFFVLDELGLDNKLRENFFLAGLLIKKDFPNKLIIEFQERTSIFNLCLEEKCFRVDYLGNVIARVNKVDLGGGIPLVYYELETDANLLIDTNDTNADGDLGADESDGVSEHDDLTIDEYPTVVPGKTKIPVKKVRAILDLFELLRGGEGSLETEWLEIYDFDGTNKKLGAKMAGEYMVYFNEEDDLREQVDNLILILSKEIKSNIDNISYIDLRFGNRIFYR